jgi:hypothetical protein
MGAVSGKPHADGARRGPGYDEATGYDLTMPRTKSANRDEQDDQEDKNAPGGSDRYGPGKSLAHPLSVDARDETDRRVRAQRDKNQVQQEQDIKRHADSVDKVDIQNIEE